MRAGHFKINITPPLGMDMAGYAQKRAAKEILDDLFASAIVIEKDGGCIALVGVDVLAITVESVSAIRKMIEENTDIPGKNVLIAASHTHTGPTTVEIFNSKPDPEWMKIFEQQVASSVILAHKRLQPVKLTAGIGSDDSFMFNRRLLNGHDQVEMTLDQNLTDLRLIPESGIDPSVNTLLISDLSGKPLAVLVNYGNHLDIPTGVRYSADYPGVMAKTIQALLGEQVGVVFLNGCCGDVEHLNPFDSEDMATRDRYYDSKGIEKMEKYGKVLGCEAVRTVLSKAYDLPLDTIIVKQTVIKVPVRQVNEKTIEWARSIQFHPEGSSNREKTMANEALLVHALKDTTVDVELQVMAMGDLAIIGIPAEVFVEIGLEIKKKSPFPLTFVAELANGWVGYIPTEKAFSHGGYETLPARSSKLIPSADSLIIQNVVRLLTDIKNQQNKMEEVL